MISVTDQLSLQSITLDDQPALATLMQRIYPPIYRHLWPDDGAWYLNHCFQRSNLQKELSDPEAFYGFVIFEERTIGILRTVENRLCPDAPHVPATKLHRIYLDPLVIGRGIGKQILQWTEERSKLRGQKIIWLEAMDTQEPAIRFYQHCGYELSGKFRLDFELMYPERRGMVRMMKQL